MKTKPITSRLSVLAALAICTLAFTSDMGRSQYVIPLSANVITSADLDLDGDLDLVTGHAYNWKTHWSGISIIQNTSGGQFSLSDSVFFWGGQTTLMCGQLDDVENPEIIFREWITQQLIGVLYNNNLADTFFIPVNSTKAVEYMSMGDVDGNGLTDLVLCSNLGKYWKIIYNHGYKNFTSSPFYSIPAYYPVDMACGDLNNDGRADVVICGQYLEVYISGVSGFQKTYTDQSAFKDKVAISDFNLDGYKDIIADNGSVVNSVWTNIYQNLGNGNFNRLDNYSFLPGASGISVNDFNNDTLPDIAYLMYTSPGDTSGIKIAYNLGNFQISEPHHVNVPNLGESLRSFHSADLDGNGYNDFAVVRSVSYPLQNLELLFNDGYGNFGPEPFVGLKQNPKNNLLLSCYPNPVLNQATFSYTMDKPARVELQIYSINGQLLSNPVDGWQNPGLHSISWINPGNIHGLCVVCLKVDGEITDILKVILL